MLTAIPRIPEVCGWHFALCFPNWLLEAAASGQSLCREVPAELRRLARGGQVNLDMEDHRDEEYVKPKSVFKAFTGEGQKLGR